MNPEPQTVKPHRFAGSLWRSGIGAAKSLLRVRIPLCYSKRPCFLDSQVRRAKRLWQESTLVVFFASATCDGAILRLLTACKIRGGGFPTANIWHQLVQVYLYLHSWVYKQQTQGQRQRTKKNTVFCVCVRADTYIHTYICTYIIHIYIYPSGQPHVCIDTCMVVCTSLYVTMCVCMHAWMGGWVDECIDGYLD